MDVVPVVIGPHEGKGHARTVGRLEEAVVQAMLKVGAVLVVVPVVKERGDAVVGGQIDLLGGPLGVGLVKVTPGGHDGLPVAGKARTGVFHQVPLGPALAVPGFVTRIDVIVREVICRDNG